MLHVSAILTPEEGGEQCIASKRVVRWGMVACLLKLDSVVGAGGEPGGVVTSPLPLLIL